MKIGILAHDLIQAAVRGLSRYTAGLVRGLAESGAAGIVLFAREPLASSYTTLPGERCIWNGRREVLWEQWDLPRMAALKKVDLIHSPSNRGLCAFSRCPTVLTRHDAIERLFPPDFPGSLRSRFRMFYSDEIAVRRASAVATITATSKRDILSVWKIPENKVYVAGEGIDEKFFRAASSEEVQRIREKYDLKAPYILYLGGMDPRKDVVTLVEAYARWRRRDFVCVLAGSTRGCLNQIEQAIISHGLEGSVRILGEVDDRDVPGLYAASACFVYPSRYEGLGLQAAEAMAMGIPLIVSDGGALPEVAGDSALIFKAGDAEGLRECLERMLDDKNLRESLVARGRSRAEQFKWERVIPRYLSMYRRVQEEAAA